MGEATNSSSGRATRRPESSRSRGTTVYERLEEARLRRQVVLAAKNAPAPSNSSAEPAVVRSSSSIVEPAADIAENQEEVRLAAETSLGPIVDLDDDSDVGEIAPAIETYKTAEAPWRLVGPGVAAGFVFAMVVVVWGEAQIASVTSRTVIAGAASSQALAIPGSNSTLSASALPAIEAGLVALDAPDDPTLEYVPGAGSSTSRLQPAPVDLAALDPTPAVFSSPPKPATAAPLVLGKTPPARPSLLEPDTLPKPAFPGLEIVLHIPNGAQASDTEALIGAASGAGFEIAATRPAGFKISRTNVRYFHKKDAQAARALAQAIDGRFRDFTSFTPPPDPGVIEVWLKGQGSPARTN